MEPDHRLNSAREVIVPLKSDTDIVQARQIVRRWTEELKFSLVEQTKFVTAASELARNTVLHGGGGEMRAQLVRSTTRSGIKLIFEDRGPGIPDLEKAMRDGFTTKGGLGLGLPGTKRLVNEFDIQTTIGEGTKITIVRWK